MSATRSLSAAVRGLGDALADGPPDADLVGRFAAGRDEAAFALLVRRHGPVVLGVCRRLLRHEQDAEDAFQATFLVLARKAGAVRRSGAVGNWLYGVAVNVARKARAARLRRAAVEREAVRPADAPAREWDDLAGVIDRELAALPDKYRTAVVLCDLGGRTVRDAAAAVGCPAKTLGTRLLRGRALLAGRLARRGVVAPAVLTVAVPPRLSGSVLRFAVGRADVPPAVAALAHGAVSVMTLTTAKWTAAVACGLVVAGALAVDGRGPAAQPPASAARPAPVESPAWKHFKTVCGDTAASKALFAELTADPDRAELFDRAARDPAEAAKLYAATAGRLGPAGRAAYWDYPFRSVEDHRKASREVVPAADVGLVLFLGSFPPPADFADPEDVHYVLAVAFHDLVTGPRKDPARKLFAAWLDRRTAPRAVNSGFEAAVAAGAKEVLPTARRWATDPKAEAGVVGLAAVVVGTLGTPADLSVLSRLRDDARADRMYSPAREGEDERYGQVRERAAALSLRLRGRDLRDFGFPTAVAGSRWYVDGPNVETREPGPFRKDEDRDAVLKKAWDWLDAQPKPEPEKR